MSAWTALAGRLRRVLDLPARRVLWITFGVLAIPFVIAALVLSSKHWNPVLDLAMTELRVRDVFGAHTPLIGLPGRIGHFPDQGSHPGPLSFYLLTPVYRATGASAYGLLLGMIVLDLIAIGLALWIAERRGGTRFVLGIGGILAFVVHGYGIGVLSQPWNPYLPLLFWVVVLLATWSVLLGDLPMIVVVAVVGSLCAQTHMPYLGLCVGLGALCLAWFVVLGVQHPIRRNELQRWGGTAVVAAVVLWIPVIIDQARNTPGNLSMLNDYFRNPPEEPVGIGEGVHLILRHLNVFRVLWESIGVAGRGGGAFVESGFRLDGSVVPGVVFLVLWLAGVGVAIMMRHRALVALDAVLAAALVLATISMSRIFGKVWYYLTLWAWSLTVLMLASIVWTAFAWAGLRAARAVAPPEPPEAESSPATRSTWWTGPWRAWPWRRLVAIAGAVAVVGTYVPLVVDGARASVPEPHLSTTLRDLVGPTAIALRDGVGAADGKDGTYVVMFSDAMYFGSQAYGLVSELERRGFHVGMTDTYHVPITQHRVVDPVTATAEIRLATGSYIEAWRAVPGVEEVAYVEPRDADALAEYGELDAELRAGLAAAGLGDLVGLVDTNLFGVQLDPRLPRSLQSVVNRMLELGQPEAVFIVPPNTPSPV